MSDSNDKTPQSWLEQKKAEGRKLLEDLKQKGLLLDEKTVKNNEPALATPRVNKDEGENTQAKEKSLGDDQQRGGRCR